MKHAIEIKDVSVRFGDVLAVSELSFDVAAGAVFGFLGPNGAGKTTTIRVMLDLLRPDAGSARLLGEDSRNGGGRLRSRVGFLPGDLALFPSLDGRATLDFFADLYGGRRAARENVLERLGLDDRALDRKVRTYSTGMRQKLGIVCAFQHVPELLVLDEPTTGLDPIVRGAFLDLVADTAGDGRTVLFSSHVLAEVEACADRVALIHGGRLRLVEDVASLRARLPRVVRLRWDDGRTEERSHDGSAEELVESIDARGLVDVEIRPADLGDVFRSIVGPEDAS